MCAPASGSTAAPAVTLRYVRRPCRGRGLRVLCFVGVAPRFLWPGVAFPSVAAPLGLGCFRG